MKMNRFALGKFVITKGVSLSTVSKLLTLTLGYWGYFGGKSRILSSDPNLVITRFKGILKVRVVVQEVSKFIPPNTVKSRIFNVYLYKTKVFIICYKPLHVDKVLRALSSDGAHKMATKT